MSIGVTLKNTVKKKIEKKGGFMFMKPITNLCNIASVEIIENIENTFLLGLNMCSTYDRKLYVGIDNVPPEKYYGIRMPPFYDSLKPFMLYKGELTPNNCYVNLTSEENTNVFLRTINHYVSYIRYNMLHRRVAKEYKLGLGDTSLFIRFYNEEKLNGESEEMYH